MHPLFSRKATYPAYLVNNAARQDGNPETCSPCLISYLFIPRRTLKAELDKAALAVNAIDDEDGLLAALRADVGAGCKCLSLFSKGHPLNPHEEEPKGLTYAVRAVEELLSDTIRFDMCCWCVCGSCFVSIDLTG